MAEMVTYRIESDSPSFAYIHVSGGPRHALTRPNRPDFQVNEYSLEQSGASWILSIGHGSAIVLRKWRAYKPQRQGTKIQQNSLEDILPLALAEILAVRRPTAQPDAPSV
jgi:hypothetical protein